MCQQEEEKLSRNSLHSLDNPCNHCQNQLISKDEADRCEHLCGPVFGTNARVQLRVYRSHSCALQVFYSCLVIENVQ